MKPCDHKDWTKEGCRICWLYANDPTYKELWDGEPPPPQIEGPSSIQKVVNFTKAVIHHVAAGAPESTPEEKARRLSICVVCVPYYVNGTCKHGCCGCNLDVKTGWADMHCPIEKW